MSAISSRTTMPSHLYVDPAAYETNVERVFYRTWQYVGHVCTLPEPGSFFTARIANESLIIVRDEERELHAFYNVCRHRAHRVVEGSGIRPRFVCPYHAWTYGLDGCLLSAPKTEEVAGFDRNVKLREVRLEVFCGLIFVNLDDDAPALGDDFPGLEAEVLAAKPTLADMQLVFEDRITHECNWKVSVENFSECYHCPVAHRYITTNLYSADEYRVSIKDKVTYHHSPRLEDRETHGDLHVWFMWPNLAIELFPAHRSISIRHFAPAGPRETIYSYLWFTDRELAKTGVDEVVEMGETYRGTNGAEDASIVANVQQGLESRSYDVGQLVITPSATAQSEHGVAHFQSLYLAAIET